MPDSPKIGAGHASAMLRLGFKELKNAMNPSRDSIADTEMGLVGNKPPGEIQKERQPDSPSQQYEQER